MINNSKSRTVVAKPRSAKTLIFDILIAAVFLLISYFSITTKSFWTDEGITWSFVSADSIVQLFQRLFHAVGSNKLLPLYFVYEWVWCRIFGFSEFAMRSSNLLFSLIILWSIMHLHAGNAKKRLLILLVAICPIYIYYMNEARPYIALMALGFLFVQKVIACPNPLSKKASCWAHALIIVGMLVHFFFAVMFVFYMVHLLILRVRMREEFNARRYIKIMLFFLPLYILIGIYIYVSHVAGIGCIGLTYGSAIYSVIVANYYLWGFGGLWLPRTELRDIGRTSLTRLLTDMTLEGILQIMVCVILGIAIVYLVITLIRMPKNTQQLTLLIGFIVSFLLMFGFAFVTYYNFWDRHVIFLMPVILILICDAVLYSNKTKILKYCIIGVFMAGWLLSSGNLRWNDRYAYPAYSEVLYNANPEVVYLVQGPPILPEYYGMQYLNPDTLETESKQSAVQQAQAVNINGYSYEQLDQLVQQLKQNKKYAQITVILSEQFEYDPDRVSAAFLKIRRQQAGDENGEWHFAADYNKLIYATLPI